MPSSEEKYFQYHHSILQLSLVETAYLNENGIIEVFRKGKPLSSATCKRYAKTVQPNLDDLLRVYNRS
jgi:tRNA splicing endonuclease